MAPRQTARRLLVAAPALVLAFGVTACSPPNQQPADPDSYATYTLPSYSEDPKPPTTTPVAPVNAGGVGATEEEYLEGTPTPNYDPGRGLWGDPVGVDDAEGIDGPTVPAAERQPGNIANN